METAHPTADGSNENSRILLIDLLNTFKDHVKAIRYSAKAKVIAAIIAGVFTLAAVLIPLGVTGKLSNHSSAPTPTPTPTPTSTPTPTPTPTSTPTPTLTTTPTPTLIPSNSLSPSPSPSPISSNVWCALLESQKVYLCAEVVNSSMCYSSLDNNSAIDFSANSIYSNMYESQEDCISNITCLPSGLTFDSSVPQTHLIEMCEFSLCTINSKQFNCVAINPTNTNSNCNLNQYYLPDCQSCINFVGCDGSDISTNYCHAACS